MRLDGHAADSRRYIVIDPLANLPGEPRAWAVHNKVRPAAGAQRRKFFPASRDAEVAAAIASEHHVDVLQLPPANGGANLNTMYVLHVASVVAPAACPDYAHRRRLGILVAKGHHLFGVDFSAPPPAVQPHHLRTTNGGQSRVAEVNMPPGMARRSLGPRRPVESLRRGIRIPKLMGPQIRTALT